MQPDPSTTDTNLRSASRIACDIPVLLDPEEKKMPAKVVDVSRTGVRIRISDAELRLHRLSTIRHVAERLMDSIGASFDIHFHPKMLGDLISRDLQLVRIASRDWEQTAVEIGCLIEGEPLRDEEAGMMGLALPLIGTPVIPSTLEGALPPASRVGRFEASKRERVTGVVPAIPTAPGSYRASCRFRASITTTGTSSSRSAPLRGIAEGISPKSGRIRLTDLGDLGFREPPQTVAEVIVALDQHFGERLALKLSDGAEHLWSGPTRVAQVELPPDRPGQAIVDLGFERPLRPAERKRLRV